MDGIIFEYSHYQIGRDNDFCEMFMTLDQKIKLFRNFIQ